MTTRQSSSVNALPLLWLLSDARNDARLERALANLPRGSGFVFRHYHLEEDERRRRFDELAAGARAYDHTVIVSRASPEWRADGVYGAVDELGSSGTHLRLATAHDGDELQAANRVRADGVFLSPVFSTRSHPDAPVLGVHGFYVLAMQSAVPVIALGGMDAERARKLDWPRWGAIDGLAQN